jgi:cell division protein FtsB
VFASRSFFRDCAFFASWLVMAATAAVPGYMAYLAADQAQWLADEPRRMEQQRAERAARRAEEARLQAQLTDLQSQLDRASVGAEPHPRVGDFPPPPPYHANLN